MIAPIFTLDCFKILTLFSLSPGSRYRRNEIKLKTKMNNVPLDKALSQLVYSGIIKKEGYYSINFEHQNYKPFLEICSKQFKSLRELPLEVYYLLLDLVYLFSVVKKVELYLFGSYAKLVYRENSDVDLAVLSEGKPRIPVAKLEKLYGKKIEIHYFSKKEFYTHKRDPLVKNILKDGIRLI